MNSSSRPNLSHEAIHEFLVETQESIEQVEADLVELERSPDGSDTSPACVSRMFRMLHSVKGSCGFLGYPKLEELAHVGENLLGRIREGILPIDATVTTALLLIVDAIREVLDHIESENNEGNQDYTNLTHHLSQIIGSDEFSGANALGETLALPEAAASALVESQELIDDPTSTTGHSKLASAAAESFGGKDRGVALPSDSAILSQSDSIIGSLNISKASVENSPNQSGSGSASDTARKGKDTADSRAADSLCESTSACSTK